MQFLCDNEPRMQDQRDELLQLGHGIEELDVPGRLLFTLERRAERADEPLLPTRERHEENRCTLLTNQVDDEVTALYEPCLPGCLVVTQRAQRTDENARLIEAIRVFSKSATLSSIVLNEAWK